MFCCHRNVLILFLKLGVKNEGAKFLRNNFILGYNKNVYISAHNLTMETWSETIQKRKDAQKKICFMRHLVKFHFTQSNLRWNSIIAHFSLSSGIQSIISFLLLVELNKYASTEQNSIFKVKWSYTKETSIIFKIIWVYTTWEINK